MPNLLVPAVKAITKAGVKEAAPVAGRQLAEEIVVNTGRALDTNLKEIPFWAATPKPTRKGIMKQVDATPEQGQVLYQRVLDADAGDQEAIEALTVNSQISHIKSKIQQDELDVRNLRAEVDGIDPKQLLKDSKLARYNQLVEENQAILQASGGTRYPGTDEQELLDKIQEYTTLRQDLNKLDPKLKFGQPRRGWEKVFGDWTDKDGLAVRVSGGTETNPKPMEFKTKKHELQRGRSLDAYPTQATTTKTKIPKERKRPKIKGIEKHHVAHAKVTEPFMTLSDGSLRPLDERIEITEALADRYGIHYGDQDLNEMYQSGAAHMGKGLSDKSLASHRILEASTDIQGIRDWRTQAREIKWEMPPLKGGKNKRYIWLDNGPDGVPLSKRSGKPYPLPKGSEAIEFRMEGPGTYEVGQRHGFTLELQKLLSSLEDPEDVIEAVRIFYQESGAMEAMQGAAALATRTIDADLYTDEITAILSKKYSDDMMMVVQDLLKLPEYKDNPILIGLLENHKANVEPLVKEFQTGSKAVGTPPELPPLPQT